MKRKYLLFSQGLIKFYRLEEENYHKQLRNNIVKFRDMI